MTLRDALNAKGLRLEDWCRAHGLSSSMVFTIRQDKRARPRYVRAVVETLGVSDAAAIVILTAPAPQRTIDSGLARLVKASGMSRAEIAEEARVSIESLNDCCSGRSRNPRPETAIGLARVLGVTPQEIARLMQQEPGATRSRRLATRGVPKSRPAEDFAPVPSADVDPVALARFRKAFEQGWRFETKDLRPASPRAYDRLREALQAAQASVGVLDPEERHFASRLEYALESFQRWHGLERVREAA